MAVLDRLVASPALAGPELAFLSAQIAERRGDTAQAAGLVTECLQELPGCQEYQEFALEVGTRDRTWCATPSLARRIAAEVG